MILANLAIKAYIRKSKTISAKKVTSNTDWTQDLSTPLVAPLLHLTFASKTETFRILIFMFYWFQLIHLSPKVLQSISHGIRQYVRRSCQKMNGVEESFTVTTDNITLVYKNLSASNSLILNNEDSVWIIFLQQSQLIMTIVGIIANIGTSITLIKNGQVGMNSVFINCFISLGK